jgi:integrase
MLSKRLKSGDTGYYWNPPKRDLAAGFTLSPETLGHELGAAISRAHALNRHLDDWRAGRDSERSLDLQPGFGTLDWLLEQYFRSRAFAKVSKRVQPDYRRELELVRSIALKDGRMAGQLSLKAVTAAFVDKLYDRLLVGKRKLRTVRRANISIARANRAWDAVWRLHPQVVPAVNPFAGVEREHSAASKAACSRDEAFALADALQRLGHPHLALAPLVCFEWLQRPENVLGGYLAWSHWRPSDHPSAVQIFHHKTGERVWYPLEDDMGQLCPEIESRLAQLPRLGVAVVLTPGTKGEPRPYSYFYARALVRKARRLCGLGEHVTLDACRHGGMTELGDSDLTEQAEMALSGHKNPQTTRRYVKRTETQRLNAARKRRAWVEERKEAVSQNEQRRAESE